MVKTVYEQIAFMDRIVSALKHTNEAATVRDIWRTCLEWMGWDPEQLDRPSTTPLTSGALIVPPQVHGPNLEPATNSRLYSSMIKVHVGTRYVDVPFFVRQYHDTSYRFDIWSKPENVATLSSKNPDSCMALIDLLADAIKSRL